MNDMNYAGSSWLHFFLVATLGIWLGAMIFFSFFFAPAAFHVIPSRHLTGTLVTLLLTRLNFGTLILVPIWLLLSVAQSGARSGWPRGIQLVLLVLTALSSAISQFVLMPKMVALRAQMVSIDTTPIDSPLRIAFNGLHKYSVSLMGFNMLALLVVLFIATREKRA